MPVGASRARVPIPEGLRIVEAPTCLASSDDYRGAPRTLDRFVVTRSWFSPQLFFQLFFCVAWDGFLVFWYATAIAAPAKAGPFMFVFPIAHVAVGLALTYRTLAGFLNKTWIIATGESLTIRHAPLPWRGNRTIAVSDVHQIFCEKVASKGRRGSSTSYALSVVLADGRKLQLITALPSADQALFLEQQLEERLGIVAAPVGGEYTGS
jgi:hypothetical protein